MVGTAIHYTQLGCWLYRTHYGFRSVKVDTKNGRRTILKPDENEAKFIIKLFEMHAAHIYTNQQIADWSNSMSFRSHVTTVRDKYDRTKIKRQIGNKQMTAKMIDQYASKLVYCGIIKEKWIYDNHQAQSRARALEK